MQGNEKADADGIRTKNNIPTPSGLGGGGHTYIFLMEKQFSQIYMGCIFYFVGCVCWGRGWGLDKSKRLSPDVRHVFIHFSYI